MLDPANILRAAGEWALARGWREKLAKQRAYQQSLLEHSLIEIDVLLQLLPILSSPWHYDLREAEQKILLVADHNAYHIGQIVALRRRLGIW